MSELYEKSIDYAEGEQRMKTLSIGLGNFVQEARVIAIISPESAPVKRMVRDAKDKSLVVDSTYGRPTRAVIVMDNGSIVLSAIQPETIINRNNKEVTTNE